MGGILSVESLDEFEAVMFGFPFEPFSETEVLPLADLAASRQRQKAMVQAMTGRGQVLLSRFETVVPNRLEPGR